MIDIEIDIKRMMLTIRKNEKQRERNGDYS